MASLGIHVSGQVLSSEQVSFGDKQVQRVHVYYGEDKLLLLYVPMDVKVELGKVYTFPLQGLRQDKYGKLVANLRKNND